MTDWPWRHFRSVDDVFGALIVGERGFGECLWWIFGPRVTFSVRVKRIALMKPLTCSTVEVFILHFRPVYILYLSLSFITK